MGKKSAPPPAPDYTQAAEKTAASSQDAQTRADWSNRPEMDTPWGTSSWTSQAAVDPATGKPVTQWSNKVSLAGGQQDALDDQMAIQSGKSDIASGMMGRLNESYRKPYDPSQLQGYGQVGKPGQGLTTDISGGAGADARTRIENSMWERMQPQQQQAQAGLEGKLQNMGLTRGSEAWNRETQRLGDQQSRERFNVMDRGLAEQQGQFGMERGAAEFGNTAQGQGWQQGMQGAEYQTRLRQQQIAEQLQQRAIPLNELNALLTGSQVAMPGFQDFKGSTSAGGANYSGAARDQYSGAMDAYNAKQAQQQSMMQGIGGIASMGMMMMSDARLKSNIVRVDEHPLGIGIYEFDIQGQRERGVLAQEVLEVAPHLVHQHRSGYLMVNYGGLQ